MSRVTKGQSHRLITFPGFLMIGAVLALSLAAIYQSYQRASDSAASRLAAGLAVGENSISRTLDSVSFALGTIAAAFDLAHGDDPAAARALAAEILGISPYIRQVLITDADGRVMLDTAQASSGMSDHIDLASLGLSAQAGEQENRLAIGHALQTRYLSVREAVPSGQWAVPAVFAVRRRNGALLNVVATLNPMFFVSVLDAVRTEERVRIAMVRFDGAPLAASPAQDGAQFVSPQILGRLEQADHGRVGGGCPFSYCAGFSVFKSSPGYPIALITGMTRDEIGTEWLWSDWPMLVSMAVLPFLVATATWAQGRLIASRLTQAELRRLAHHDPLTGLPNRLLLDDRLEVAIGRAARNQTLLAVIFIDLDGFKQINDTYGHAVGDRVLVNVANRLRDCVRLSDTVARMGGDEFVAVLEQISDEREIRRLAAKVVGSVSLPVSLDGIEVSVGASLGIAVYPKDGADAASLLDKADEAMYRAKPAQGICFYPDTMITDNTAGHPIG
ncbi:diguanylate cyclase domain-containing protein [Telmatospirillum sp.]|uniref:diguanylate cyclase domain-containing protein n=1 Tax=Telmatospirillum sp. TaxID=2079197 RepID=UPI0028510F15|nr:diguanylate cyclase [Telmatospirillum sp.]MDR3436505.1 diguanylate cyclase [Telmatospirillum sp.]